MNSTAEFNRLYEFNAKIRSIDSEGVTTIAGTKTKEKWFEDGLARTKHVANSSLIGMILGDGSMPFKKKEFRKGKLYLRHGGNQVNYVNEKVKFLERYLKPVSLREGVDKLGYPYRYAYYNDEKLANIYHLVYKDGRKSICGKLLNRFTDVSLAFLYMDDGCLSLRKKNGRISSRYISLNLQGFSFEEVKMFTVMLKQKFNLTFSITVDKHRPRMWCNTANTRKFIGIVKPVVLFFPTMHYKLDLKYPATSISGTLFTRSSWDSLNCAETYRGNEKSLSA